MTPLANMALQNKADDAVDVIIRPNYEIHIGTGADDIITGSTKLDFIFGGDGNDTLESPEGEEDFYTGGRDRYNGGAGVDTIISHPLYYYGSTFAYTSVTDSYFDRQGSHSDLIKNFQLNDVLDLTALGLERVGNGYKGDLAVTYNADEGLTYLRSLDKNAQGQAFEVRLAGDYEGKLGTQNFVLNYALTPESDGAEHRESDKQYVITGTDGNDRLIVPHFGNTVIGGAGADKMYSGDSQTTFVFDHLTDSFVNDTSGQSSVDFIEDFELGSGDLLDVSALGFNGLGDGYNGTLNYTYDSHLGYAIAQSFESDENGNRFVLHLTQYLGDHLREVQDMDRFIFAGDRTVDRATQTLTGNDFRDTFLNSSDGGILVGQGNDDVLVGNSGVDTFRYIEESDSVRGRSDLVQNFDTVQDRIDVSALGYTGLGDGTDNTLKVVYDTATQRTYLKDYEANAEGSRFEISLDGNIATTFTNNNLIVADASLLASAGQVEMVGVAASDLHPLG
jgi:Ca2+-binding RTX toxin-like protein